MLSSEHDSATCPRCGSPLWYGLKEEATGWKVFYVCDSERGCDAEWRVGRVGLDEVERKDDAYDRAEAMWTGVPGRRRIR